MCLPETLRQGINTGGLLTQIRREKDAHLYPLSLNSYVASPTFFSDKTPRGHAPLTAWSMAGVECKGGPTTRSEVEEEKEIAKGILLTGWLSEMAEPLARGKGVGEVESSLGLENATASLSSCSRP